MNINEIEFASQLAWPALEEVKLDGGVLRYAEGLTRRSNSMIPSLTAKFCPKTLISKAEKYYGGKGQAAVVKVLNEKASQQNFALLDALLEGGCYEKESPTSVMGLNLRQRLTTSELSSLSQLVQCNNLEWAKAWHSVRQVNAGQLGTYCQLLERINGKVCRLLLKKQGQVVATGMAVLQNGSTEEDPLNGSKTSTKQLNETRAETVKLGIYGMATAEKFQGKGCGSGVLSQLLSWGAQQGAGYAYLQVEDSNFHARALYTKFGFEDLYSYWYRVKDCLSHI
jgi:N-acetylglutamate synthase